MTALGGLRVVELCTGHAGPYCSKLLADMGADVVKIEPPLGDPSRREGPFPQDIPHPERSGAFLFLNTNKRGVTLNLETNSGRRIFQSLVERADILVENLPLGTLGSWECGYDQLSATHPGLICISITPFGQTGPHKEFTAYPMNTFHAGGEGYTLPGNLGWLLYSDRPPLTIAGSVGEHYAGLMAATAVLMAVHSRLATGRGQHVDLSKQEALMNLSRGEVERYLNEGVIASRATRAMAFGNVFQCKDGFIMMYLTHDHMWQALMELMGRPEWVKPEYNTAPGRAAEVEEIVPRIAEWALQHTKQEIYHEGQRLGLPVAPVASPEDIYAWPQTRARGYFVEVCHPEMGAVQMASAGYQLSRTPWSIRRPAPLLGEHNQEVFCEELGYQPQDLGQLRASGVI